MFLFDVSVVFTVANIVLFVTITYTIMIKLIYSSSTAYLKESVALVE